MSPIKAELETIYNNGQVESRLSTSSHPHHLQATQSPPSGQGVEIVFTTQLEEEEKAQQKAAVKAMEFAFAKKKRLAEEKAKREAAEAAAAASVEANEEGEDDTHEAPVPLKRTSIKKKTEYTAVSRASGSSSTPLVKIGDLSTSGTDYRALSVPLQ